MTDSNKHSRLLRYGIDYDRKKFYITGSAGMIFNFCLLKIQNMKLLLLGGIHIIRLFSLKVGQKLFDMSRDMPDRPH